MSFNPQPNINLSQFRLLGLYIRSANKQTATLMVSHYMNTDIFKGVTSALPAFKMKGKYGRRPFCERQWPELWVKANFAKIIIYYIIIYYTLIKFSKTKSIALLIYNLYPFAHSLPIYEYSTITTQYLLKPRYP